MIKDFFDEQFENLILHDKPFIVRDFYDDPSKLATWKDVEEVCNNGNYPGYIMHPQIGKIIADGGEWNFHPNVKDRFDCILNGGGACILHYDAHNAHTNELAKFFEDRFNVDARFFLQAQLHPMDGYGLHSDDRNTVAIFIVQIEGTTSWKVYDNRQSSLFDNEHPRSKDFFVKYKNDEGLYSKMDLVLEETLYPGDLIYIPHRMYHWAVPSEKRISLSIPCSAREEGNKPHVNRGWYRLQLIDS